MWNYRTWIPVLLFVAFAGAHRLSVMSEPTVGLVRASRDLTAGHRLEVDDIDELVIRGPEAKVLGKTFIEHRKRGTDLLFNRINREIKRGELITLRDLAAAAPPAPLLGTGEVGVHVSLEQIEFAAGQMYVGMMVGFLIEPMPSAGDTTTELLAPFKVVGVGDRVSETTLIEPGQRSDPRILTIAVPRDPMQPDRLIPQAMRLIRALGNDPSRPERIRALVMLPVSGDGNKAPPDKRS